MFDLLSCTQVGHMTTIEVIRERLEEVRILGKKENIVQQGLVRRIEFEGGRVTVSLALPPQLDARQRQVLEADLRLALGALDHVREVVIEAASPGESIVSATPASPIPGVRRIVAVSSAKGGVGKSTVTVGLAFALQRRGQRVGVLDLDVYGPSLSLLLGLAGPPQMADERRLLPLEKLGLQLMSVGFFLEEDAPVIWRGPVVMSLVRQFLRDVAWRDLDVLLVDLPPGTGDAALSLIQFVPLAGAVIVTTPQRVAIADVERGMAMFEQVQVPILGVVENMATYVCPHCGRQEKLFASGGAERLSKTYRVPLLARLPFDPELREASDRGDPLVARRPDHPIARMLERIAEQVLDALGAEAATEVAPRIFN